MAIIECARASCPTREEPNGKWWVVAAVEGYKGRQEFRAAMHRPDAPLISGEHLVCGEACVTRLMAAWMADQQHARGQRVEQERVLAEIERQF